MFDLNYTGDVPARLGYLLGFKVIAAATRDSAFDTLVTLDADGARRTMALHLTNLAKA